VISVVPQEDGRNVSEIIAEMKFELLCNVILEESGHDSERTRIDLYKTANEE